MSINITVNQIMAWDPCKPYDRQRVEELWGERAALTPQEIAGLPIPTGDRVWALARPEVVGERAYLEWGYECAARVLPLWERWAAENRPEFKHVPRQALEAARRGEITAAEAEAAVVAEVAAREAAITVVEAARGSAVSRAAFLTIEAAALSAAEAVETAREAAEVSDSASTAFRMAVEREREWQMQRLLQYLYLN